MTSGEDRRGEGLTYSVKPLKPEFESWRQLRSWMYVSSKSHLSHVVL